MYVYMRMCMWNLLTITSPKEKSKDTKFYQVGVWISIQDFHENWRKKGKKKKNVSNGESEIVQKVHISKMSLTAMDVLLNGLSI